MGSAKVGDEGAQAAPEPWSKSQIAALTSKNRKRLTTFSLLLFAFVDTLGTILFQPAGSILCQRADKGPMSTYSQLMQLPNTTDWAALGVYDSAFIDLHATTSDAIKASYSVAEMSEYVWQNIGMPKAFPSVPFGFSISINIIVVGGNLAGGLVRAEPLFDPALTLL